MQGARQVWPSQDVPARERTANWPLLYIDHEPVPRGDSPNGVRAAARPARLSKSAHPRHLSARQSHLPARCPVGRGQLLPPLLSRLQPLRTWIMNSRMTLLPRLRVRRTSGHARVRERTYRWNREFLYPCGMPLTLRYHPCALKPLLQCLLVPPPVPATHLTSPVHSLRKLSAVLSPPPPRSTPMPPPPRLTSLVARSAPGHALWHDVVKQLHLYPRELGLPDAGVEEDDGADVAWRRGGDGGHGGGRGKEGRGRGKGGAREDSRAMGVSGSRQCD